jgi:quinol monooxygenase YgiN
MSIIELARLRAKAGQEDAMGAALPAAFAVLETAEGCLSASGLRCIERPDEFTFFIRWTDVEHHLRFRESAEFARYRGAFAEHLGEVVDFAHYDEL